MSSTETGSPFARATTALTMLSRSLLTSLAGELTSDPLGSSARRVFSLTPSLQGSGVLRVPPASFVRWRAPCAPPSLRSPRCKSRSVRSDRNDAGGGRSGGEAEVGADGTVIGSGSLEHAAVERFDALRDPDVVDLAVGSPRRPRGAAYPAPAVAQQR